MKLEKFAVKHGLETSDYASVYPAAERGWRYTAVFTDPDDAEPVMILVQAPTWPNYQVRNISSDLASGTMLTEQQVKQWIKSYAAKHKPQ